MGDFRIFGLLFCLFLGQTALGQSQQVPSRSLKIGARNSTIRNIGSLQVDSAFIFPKRLAKDTTNSKALKRKGAFFYDSSEHVVWFYNGSKFRRIDSGTNIYTSDGKIEKLRTVEIDGAKKVALKFVKGAVHFDTLLVKKRDGLTTDSFLTRFHDTVRYVGPDSLPNIYNKDGSLKGNREVNLGGQGGHSNNNFNLKFKGGAVIFDTLLLRNRKLGNSGDSFLVVRNDSVYRIARDSVFNIYNKSDSIKENRVVTLSAKNNAVGKQLYFTKGAVLFDTLLLKKSKIGTSRDTLLVRFKDTVKYIPFDSLRNIYTKSDSIKEARVVTLRGRQNGKASIYFKDGQFLLDTLLLRKKIKGSSRDSFLVMHKDTVRYIPFDSLRNIYNVDDSIKKDRIVTLADSKNSGKKLHFAKGSVHIDTLLVKPREGRTTDSFLTRFHDTVRYVAADSLPNIYNKDDTLKSNRIVYISKKGKHFNLHFTKGAVHIDTLLLRNRKLGNSGDSLLVVRHDSVYRIGRDSVFNIYTKSDSIKEARVVTLRGRQNGKASIYFKDGQFSLDTLLIRKKIKGGSRDSFLVMHKDTVRYIPFDSLRSIYTKSDSIKENRVVTLSAQNGAIGKQLYFTKGSVVFDTLLVKNRKLGNSGDSLLVVRNDSVYRIGRDSVFNIYTKSDSIKEARVVTLEDRKHKSQQLHFTKGTVLFDTLLLKPREGLTTDSFLTRFHDTVRYVSADSLPNIYNKDGKLKGVRIVDIDGEHNKQLKFVKGRVELDTLFLRHLKEGSNEDSLLTIKNDTVRKIKLTALSNIYTKSDSIKETRTVTLASAQNKPGTKLHFTQGSVHIDTLLLRNGKLGNSGDSLLVVRNDSVYRIGRDSVFNIYNKSDSIREYRIVTIRNHNKQKDVKLAFKDGRVEIDTLLIRKRRLGLSKDSFLTVWNDTVRSVPYDSLWNIYTKDDSIRNVKSGKRVIDLNNHSIVFKSTVPNGNSSGSNTNNADNIKGHSRFGILQENPKYTLDIATPQFLQAHDNTNASSADSIAVRIQHVVRDYKYGYGVMLSEFSNKAKGMSSLGFQGWRNGDNTASNQEVDHSKTYVKSAIWSQVGARRRHPILGFSVSDTNYNLQRRMFINSQGNVIIGEYKDVDKELDNTPARLVVNSSSFEGSLKLNGINPEDVSILTNGGRHTNDSRYRIKYGLVMKESSYDMGSRVAMAFYGGGNTNSARRESSSMAARIWASMGSEIANPEFGIDVGSGTATNGEALNSYTPNQTTSMPNRLYINKWGNIGMGHQAPKTNVEISRANNNNVLRVHAGGHNKTNWQSALWLTVKDSDTGWYMGHTAQSGILKFTYTNKREGDNSSNVQGHMGQYTNTNEKLKNVLALIPKPDGGHIGIGTQSYVQDNIFIDVQRQDKANFLRIQAGSTNQENTLCGLWLSEHNILYGWRVQYNPQNDQLQFKQTSSDAYGDGNSSGVNIYFDGRGSNTAIVTPTVRNTSDSTLKKHIRKLTADLPDKLMQIRPVSYYWKDDSLMLPTSIRYGFLAQEVQKIFPSLVSTDTVEGKARMSMNYLDLISPMVAMLQKHEKKAQVQESKLAELKQQVTNLQSANEALQKQNQRQEQRLNELENQMRELYRILPKPATHSSKNDSMIER